MRVDLIRVESGEKGTFGVLTVNGEAVCVSLERPWANNCKNVSCIPKGVYSCSKVKSPKYGDTYEVCDVEGRTDILFHWGNFISNSKGCILTGASYGEIDGERAVTASKSGFNKFMKILDNVDSFALNIIEI